MTATALAPPATGRPSEFTPLAQTLFAVPGISCAGCMAKIEGKLPLTAGIAAARVNLTARQVRVDHLADMTLPELGAAFTAIGFSAQPVTTAISGPAHGDSRDLLRAMAVAGFAMMNIMLLSVSVWSGAEGSARELFHWLSALIALPTVAYSGRPFFRSAVRALKARTTNMDVPISIGVVLTCAMSLYETATGGAHAYFDGAVMLLFFLLCGRFVDSVMRERARDGVTALLKHSAPGAVILEADGSSRWLSAEALAAGMAMLVAAGERLAADGMIVDGISQIDQALLTGEARPVAVSKGTTVHAGTLNLDAPIKVRITASGADTTIADIARLMEAAGQGRSRYVRIADRAARLYAPAVHSLALASFVGWMIAGAGWHASLLIAVAVLIITCPCALGLAVPAAQIVAAGRLMRSGILVKDGSALERLAEVDRILFDKTGTLTLGRPQLLDLDKVAPDHRPVLLALAQASRHPLSEAVRRALELDGGRAETITAITEIPGHGVTALFQGCAVGLVRCDDAARAAGQLACRFETPDGNAVTLHFADALRPDAVETVNRLAALALPGSILSGDSARAVAPIAQALGLTSQTAMRPDDKLAAIERLSAAGQRVLMVGDGLNDGPALAAGHASVAPASASDAGQQAADAIIMGDSLAPLVTLITVARATSRIIRQNFAIAIAYNGIAVPLAIAGQVTPLIAALAMSGSSIIVVANALRLRSVGR
jgi:P-type Cu2+ transporter